LTQERRMTLVARIAGGVGVVAGITFIVIGRTGYGLTLLLLSALNLIFLGRREEARPRDVGWYLMILSVAAAVGAFVALLGGALGIAGMIGDRPIAMGVAGLVTTFFGAVASVLFWRAARDFRRSPTG
jgi:hypothetical protein